MFSSLHERRYGKQCQAKYGPYIMAFFVPHGMYQNWLGEFPIEEIYNALALIADTLKCRVLLTGAEWDKVSLIDDLMKMDAGFDRKALVDLTGQTTLEELFGLMRSSEGCIGFPGGNTIMSAVFKKPTLLIWNKYFDKRFWKNCCPPDSHGNWYVFEDTADNTGKRVGNAFVNLVESCKVQS